MRAAVLSAAFVSAGAWSSELSGILSATHWAPCYWNTTAPSLIDGLNTLRPLGTRAIKLALDAPTTNYPWHSDWSGSYPTVAALARHPYYAAAFADEGYSTYSLIVQSQGDKAKTPCAGAGYDAAAAAVDTAQLGELTAHLLATYPRKTWILDSWEQDWWVRCGSYDPNTPPAPAVVDAYTRWLAARQAGVTAARVAACVGRGWSAALCAADEGAAAAAVAGGAVWHAAEVNLVLTSLTQGRANLINTAVPRVALDMITYSSYDCMGTRLFGACLDFIRAHHNRTAASPTPALAIAEWGVAEMSAPKRLLPVARNVVSTVLSDGAGTPGVRRVAVAFFWELFNNEVNRASGDRCNAATGPSFNASEQNGFWLVRPNMTRAPAWDFLAALINGSAPPPPLLPATFSVVKDSDVVGNDGGATVAVGGTDPAACELPCLADERCTAVVFWQGSCFLKYGGSPSPAGGRVLLTLDDA